MWYQESFKETLCTKCKVKTISSSDRHDNDRISIMKRKTSLGEIHERKCKRAEKKGILDKEEEHKKSYISGGF